MDQTFSEGYSLDNKTLASRYHKTIKFVEKCIRPPANILDLGIENLMGNLLKEKGYSITNTEMGLDLDTHYTTVETNGYDVVTAFEIFEHLVAPYNILKEIKAKQLIASIPLNLWFAKAYWNEKDEWDRHYHEFEPRQFDMLLDKAGWEIIDSEKWVSRTHRFGIRPLLRRFTPRYYIVHCKRK